MLVTADIVAAQKSLAYEVYYTSLIAGMAAEVDLIGAKYLLVLESFLTGLLFEYLVASYFLTFLYVYIYIIISKI